MADDDEIRRCKRGHALTPENVYRYSDGRSN